MPLDMINDSVGQCVRSYVKSIVSSMNDFKPESVGLNKDFRLTKLTELKGCGCKVPREPLLNLLQQLKGDSKTQRGPSPDTTSKVVDDIRRSNEPEITADVAHGFKNGSNDTECANHVNRIGVGMDSCVIPLKYDGLYLVQTTDFFFPLIEDPYMMGRVTAANVLSDLYAMGVVDCDNMLMLLGVSTRMSEEERDIVMPIIIKGFKDCCDEAGTTVTGGQTVRNEWLLLGGVASSVCSRNLFLMPDRAQPGDMLVLTKPLGIQLAVNAHQWLEQYPEKFNRLEGVLNAHQAKRAYFRAMDSLSRLNRTAARLMHKYEAHGATDVTGFGILGHAKNLASVQKNPVSFVINTLPVIADMAAVSKKLGTGLLQGTQAETSGGLLIAMQKDKAVAFCKEIEKLEGYPAWIVGVVEEGDRTAKIEEQAQVIEVPLDDKEGSLW